MTWLVIKLRYDFAFALFNVLFNPLNAELNPICHLLALAGAHNFVHVSRLRVKRLAFESSLFWSFLKESHPFSVSVQIKVYAQGSLLRVTFELILTALGVNDPNSLLFIPDAISWCGILLERIVVAQLVYDISCCYGRRKLNTILKDPQNKICPSFVFFLDLMVSYLTTINASHCYLTFFAQFSPIVSFLQVFRLNVLYITNFTVTSLIHCFLIDIIILSMFGTSYWAACYELISIPLFHSALSLVLPQYRISGTSVRFRSFDVSHGIWILCFKGGHQYHVHFFNNFLVVPLNGECRLTGCAQ